MATISTLAINLTARTRAFEKGMRRGKKSLRSFSKTAQATTNSLKLLAGRLIAITGIAGVGILVKSTTAAIDRVGKLSDAIGVSTEALTAWGFAAQITGANAQSLQKGLQLFSRRLGETAIKTSEARFGLEALGLDSTRLRALGVEKAFLEVAESLSIIRDKTVQAGIINTLFGRGGSELINLLQLGKGGIQELAKEAERLGGTFDRIDAKKVEDLNDAITRLKLSFQGLINQAVIRFSGDAQRLVDRLTAIEKSTIKTTLTVVKYAAQLFLLSKAIKVTVSIGKTLIVLFGGIKAAAGVAALAVKGLVISLAGIVPIAGAVAAGIAAIALPLLAKKAQELNEQLEKGIGPVAEFTPRAIAAAKGVEEVNQAAKRSKVSFEAVGKVLGKLGEQLRSLELPKSTTLRFKVFEDIKAAGGTAEEQQAARNTLGRIEAQKQINSLIKKRVTLQRQLATQGLTDLQKINLEIMEQLRTIENIEGIEPLRLREASKEAEKLLGITKEIARVEAAAQAAEAAAEAKEKAKGLADTALDKLKAFAKGIIAATRTPLEIFNKQIDNLEEAFQNRLIDIVTFGRALAQANRELRGPGGEPNRLQFGAEALPFDPFVTSIPALLSSTPGGIDPQVREQQTTNEILLNQTTVLEQIQSGGLQ